MAQEKQPIRARVATVAGQPCVLGLSWRDAPAKQLYRTAKVQAASLADGEMDVVATYACTAGKDGASASYGVALLDAEALDRKVRRYCCLAASMARQMESGLYLAPVENCYWLLGLSDGVVLPQTDECFATLDDAQGALAMFRALMPDMPVFVHGDIHDILLSDQQSWQWPAISSKDASLHFVGRSSFSFDPKLLVVVPLTLAVVGAGGYFAWGHFKAPPAPTAQELEAQQRAQYEQELVTLASSHHPQHLQAAWGSMWRFYQAIARPSSGYRLERLECDLQTCRARLVAVEGRIVAPQRLRAQLDAALGSPLAPAAAGVPVANAPMDLAWPLPVRPAPVAVDVHAWAASLVSQTEVARALERLQSPPLPSLIYTFAMGATTNVAQTQSVPSGAVPVVVQRVDVTVTPAQGRQVAQQLANAFRGQPGGFLIEKDSMGFITSMRAHIFIVQRGDSGGQS